MFYLSPKHFRIPRQLKYELPTPLSAFFYFFFFFFLFLVAAFYPLKTLRIMSLHQFLLEPITCHAWNRDRTRKYAIDFASLFRYH